MKLESKLAAIAAALVAIASAGCGGKAAPKPDAVQVVLAPDVVSSQDGTLHARAIVMSGAHPLVGWNVKLSMSYTDVNGVARPAVGTTAKTDKAGELDFVFSGLQWEGAGTVTAQVLDGNGAPYLIAGAALTGDATFSVADMTPPSIVIGPPTSDLKVGRNLPVEVPIQVTDEVGVAQVDFHVESPDIVNDQTTYIATGATSATVTFTFTVPDFAQSGPTIQLQALATDLSGNTRAAPPVTLTVDPTIQIATIPGLVGSLLTPSGSLANPIALQMSPKDGKLYVVDLSAAGGCGGVCIKQVDAAQGTVSATIPITGVIGATNIAFDATGDNLYIGVIANGGAKGHVLVSAYVAGTGYGAPAACSLATSNNPPDDIRDLNVDGTTLYVLDGNNAGQNVKKLTLPCNGTQDLTDVNATGTFNAPVSLSKMPAGNLLVSEFTQNQRGDIEQTVPATGVTSLFESGSPMHPLGEPHGVEWLANGTTSFDSSLFAADCAGQRLVATKGDFSVRSAAFFTGTPLDVTFDTATGGIAYVLTGDSNLCNNGNGGNAREIFKISGL